MSNKKKKSAKIINFINKSKENNKIQTEDSEIKRMDNLAKELVDVYYDAATKSFLDIGYCFYFFTYRVLQRMIASTSFPVYQNYFKGAAKEILKNYDKWIEKYKDWDGASINDKVKGSNKPRNESDTIH
tara:strand:- start:390 stop:776 length:387 start_codon:yes stop_codon:yes gene_type:complete